jgi:hypothetical protein
MKPGSRPARAGRQTTKSAQFRHLGLKRANHSIFQINEQLGRILVGLDLQEPRVCLERVEHAGFVLPRDDDRQHGKLWATGDDDAIRSPGESYSDVILRIAANEVSGTFRT